MAPVDVAWFPDNKLVALTSDGVLRRYDSLFVAGATTSLSGTPLRVLRVPTDLVVITIVGDKPAFTHVSF